MTDYQQRFINLLRDRIFRFDLADLDFGIYRVLKYQRADIGQFLDKHLPEKIDSITSFRLDEELERITAQLDTLREQLEAAAHQFGYPSAFTQPGNLRDELATSPRGREFTKQQERVTRLKTEARFEETEENRLYNHLYNFFSRYYSDGDFEPQMRRRRDAPYVVPYRGEDVHFHWRSLGSHYVKTTEELHTYSFQAGDWHVRFELVNADVQQDDVKTKTRYFFPLVSEIYTDTVVGSGDTFVLPFCYRLPTEQEAQDYDEEGKGFQKAILDSAQTELKPDLPSTLDLDILAHHLQRYAHKHRSDYFVHPQLGAFLTEELDYYLKNEFLAVDGLTSPEAFRDRWTKFQVLRDIGYEIIGLLDTLESFQAQLFEKRRFITHVSHLVPVHYVPTHLWSEVVANQGQVQMWRDLFSLEGDVTEETLATHPTLVIDTRYFDDSFAHETLSAFDDVDEATDGLLIHAENYGALRTLAPTYSNKVKIIYIDPPYNTGKDRFLYKDEFSRHSTWLTMMIDRLRLGREMLKDDGVIFVSIDDNEQAYLKPLMDMVFGPDNFVADIIWNSRKSVSSDALISLSHYHTLFYSQDKDRLEDAKDHFRLPADPDGFANPDDDPRGPWTLDPFDAPNIRTNLTYPITNPNTGQTYRPPQGRCWRTTPEEYQRLLEDNRIKFGLTGEARPYLKRFWSQAEEKGRTPKTLWDDLPTTASATTLLQEIFGMEKKSLIDQMTPKPPALIERIGRLTSRGNEWFMDFFAGSGTTGYAVMNLNREDGGRRKFILVEMGDHFDTLLLPGIVKKMYTPVWADGIPQQQPVFNGLNHQDMYPEWIRRSPRLVKVLSIESFEDSLNALELPDERRQREGGQISMSLADELRYFLDRSATESKVSLNTEELKHPFDYKLRAITPDGYRLIQVNLIETANLLLGLRPRRIYDLEDAGRRYIVLEARQAEDEVLVVWRDVDRPEPLDPEQEVAFLQKHFELGTYDAIYANADSPVTRGEYSLDHRLLQRMMVREV